MYYRQHLYYGQHFTKDYVINDVDFIIFGNSDVITRVIHGINKFNLTFSKSSNDYLKHSNYTFFIGPI